jgi:hypothetical protein
VPTKIFAVTAPAFPEGVKLDEAHNTVFLQYSGSAGTGGNMIGVPITSLANPTTDYGAECLQELGTTLACSSTPNGYLGAYAASPFNFAVDANGYLYVPNSYEPYDVNGNPVTPIGGAADAVPGEPAILLFPAGITNPAPAPLGALAGFHDELGGNAAGSAPVVAIEGTTVYVLANNAGPIGLPGTANGTQVNAGLSGCANPPSANAVPDTALDTCADPTSSHLYLAGFPNATQTLGSPTTAGTNIVAPPAFMLGGDTVGEFGVGIQAPGDLFTIKDGFAYVLDQPLQSGIARQLNVYDVRHVSGFHTDISPITSIVLDPSITPSTIAIGLTGTATGGEALLRRPARVHHDVKAWARNLQRRRQALRDRMRLPLH